MRRLRSQPGYTLLELLISIAIFSGVMILALGAFARSATSTAKSNVVREKSEAARSLIDQISNDFRYISKDALPSGCLPDAKYAPGSGSDAKGFCVNPVNTTVFTHTVPSSVVMLLKYPGQNTYVAKKYYVSEQAPYTIMAIEVRDCTLEEITRPGWGAYNEPCNTVFELSGNNDGRYSSQPLLDRRYVLFGTTFTDVEKVFTGKPETKTNSGYLGINLVIKPRGDGNVDCKVSGTCYELKTTLVPGGF